MSNGIQFNGFVKTGATVNNYVIRKHVNASCSSVQMPKSSNLSQTERLLYAHHTNTLKVCLNKILNTDCKKSITYTDGQFYATYIFKYQTLQRLQWITSSLGNVQ